MSNIGPRGRQGGVPENISKMAEEYQKDIKPPYDKDDIISAFECGYMKAQSQKPLTDMTKEEKQLLLKDLCARLPYGVIVQYKGHNSIVKNKVLTGSDLDCNMEYYKPYLRSMSSMTEEESNELESITFPLMEKDWDGNENPACIRWIDIPKYMDFILSHHFDYRGLIEKGLAIEVTEENNPYENGL